LGVYEAVANPLGQVRSLALLGLLEGVIGERRTDGEPKLERAAGLAHDIHDSWGEGYAHMMLSICAADARDAGRTRRHGIEALSTESIAPLHAVALQQIARVAVERDPGQALRLLGAAAELLDHDGTDEPAFLAMRAAAARERAAGLVGAATASRLLEEGRHLNAEEVRELAEQDSIAGVRERPDGLTRRELQVAGLIGRQLSNREIAQTLFLSVRTAESHVEHILAKLNLGNRSELAAWARGNGLVDEAAARIP
jgi:DNA-binding NarL/FixJ family response regulator